MTARRHAPPSSRRRQLLGFALALPGVLGISACTPFSITRREATTLHRLTPMTTVPDNLPVLGKRILIEPPTAASGLNTARIPLRPEPTLLDFFANAQFVEVVPIMVQSLVTQSLDATGSLDVLGPDATGLRPDYVLRLHIQDFQAEYDRGLEAAPLINIRMQLRLLGMPRRESLATVRGDQTVRADGTSVAAVIHAFDQAMGLALRRIVTWTVAEIARREA
jgi:cholesterol transport system auxiliary component